MLLTRAGECGGAAGRWHGTGGAVATAACVSAAEKAGGAMRSGAGHVALDVAAVRAR